MCVSQTKRVPRTSRHWAAFLAGSITVKMRTYYSDHHIWAAAHFARMAGKIESGLSDEHPSNLFIEHRAYVTASVFAAVSFLEATINELFADAADGNTALSEKLEPAAMELLSRMWVLGVPKTASYSILWRSFRSRLP